MRERIVVFCPNLIGDTVMATPTFRALRRGFPAARIVAVIKPHVAPVLDGGPWFDDLIPFAPKARDRSQRSLGLIRRQRAERFDLAVLLPNSFRSAWLAWLGGARERVGYAKYGRGPLLTGRLAPPRHPAGHLTPTPAIEYYLRIARELGCPVDSLRTELATTPADERAADAAWVRLGISVGRRVVCLNTGGAFGPAKAWPSEHFAALAGRLVEEAGVSVLVLCGPSERDAAREIVAKAADPRVVSLADETLSIGLSKASVRRCALLITTDSGPRHFASPFNVPVLSLFGPTHIAWTRTNHPLAVHLQHRVPCGPCQRPTCGEGHHRCMRDLTPESVFRAATRLLGTTPRHVLG